MAVIEAKAISARIREGLKVRIEQMRLAPKVVVILVGDNPASEIYVRNKSIAASKLGIASEVIRLPKEVPEGELLEKLESLNRDNAVNGILVQLPLPPHIDVFKAINSISPNKDVDCLHVANVGKMLIGQPGVRPCTPNGCIYLLGSVLGKDFSGLDAVILGRSNIVGKPMFSMLLNQNASVTLLHSKSLDAAAKCRKADIIIAAVGKPRLIGESWVSEKSVVIDVGINREGDKIVGDADFERISDKVRAITPVPGGVGPMTVTFLLVNVVMLAAAAAGKHITYDDLLP